MTSTRSTCGGDSRKIDQYSTRSISRCGSIDMISCQHIQRGVGNVPVGGQDEGPSILGQEMETQQD
ncbi:hypothetical protein Gorai_002721 [Gossypium raimondii]|uniref:Uncharacterized protein n=1 Tax=Gossypium raimondii TaxID=29730 RepID=A0A7J8QMH0_GOSRA|nr:hypothetical protein [Gossypium raimondii]